jgi:hypothetical protein
VIVIIIIVIIVAEWQGGSVAGWQRGRVAEWQHGKPLLYLENLGYGSLIPKLVEVCIYINSHSVYQG